MFSFMTMHSISLRAASATVALLALSACATPSEPGNMLVSTPSTMTEYPSALHQALCVRTVTGGEGTNPLWVSNVSSGDFQSALSASLENAGLLAAPNSCRYQVDVNMLGLSQPGFGLSMEVTSHVNYKVFDAADQPVLLETITAPYTATFSDSPIGFVRVKRANEGSVKANITQFLALLRAVKPTT
jgi:hypothetical protein